jgi:ABC-type multidrug transport system fused ATPase/permease subunit
LARSLYEDADILLLDDPLSAVDTKVAKYIYEKVILKLHGKKTIILVTHQINYLSDCDWILIMENGCINYQDKPSKLKVEL